MPDGQSVVRAARSLELWNLQTGRAVWRLKGPAPEADATHVISPDGRFLVIGLADREAASLIALVSGEIVRSFE